VTAVGKWQRLSWTTDFDCAHGFAEYLDTQGIGLVFRAEVPQRAVFARYDGRGESEVIVNPFMLHSPWSTSEAPRVECLGQPDPRAVGRWRRRVRATNEAAFRLPESGSDPDPLTNR